MASGAVEKQQISDDADDADGGGGCHW